MPSKYPRALQSPRESPTCVSSIGPQEVSKVRQSPSVAALSFSESEFRSPQLESPLVGLLVGKRFRHEIRREILMALKDSHFLESSKFRQAGNALFFFKQCFVFSLV